MQPKLRRVMRLDSMPMPRAYFTPEGFLKDRPILTSTGIFEYENPDGSKRRELRLPQDVFSPESLRSYRGKPICISHAAGLIDKNNVAENQIGTILSDGERSGDDVKAEIIIHDTDAMKSAGFKELSLGYNLDLDETPGVWNGQRYDAIQRNIRINHLALVREARAGEQARLNLDGRDNNVLKGGKRMSKKTKRVPHADAVLSDEELEKALEEYDKKRGNNAAAAQADSAPEDDQTEDDTVVAEAEDPAPAAPSDEVEERVRQVKARRDRRDEEGDPKDVDDAMGMIAHQDEDIDTLFDIIDTLRAKLDFASAPAAEEQPATESATATDEIDDLEKLKGDSAEDEEDEGAMEDDPDAAPADEDVTEEPADKGDDVLSEGEEDEEAMDAFDDEEDDDFTAAGDDDIPADGDFGEDPEEEELEMRDEHADNPDPDEFTLHPGENPKLKQLNTDSVDRLVNMKIALGELGDAIGVKGLARKPIKEAKLAIIKAVHPGMRMDGRSDTYINVAFQMARNEIKTRSKKNTAYQKRQMYNKKPAFNVDSSGAGTSGDSSEAARARMNRRYSGEDN